jgi:cysteine desulfurase
LSFDGEILSDLSNTNLSSSIMSNFAPTLARQALRIASRRYPSSTFSRFSSRALAGQAHGRRSYVSETKPSKATVNVDTTIKAERKAFLEQTGESSHDATMPTTGMSADAMMSPSAGKLFHHPAFGR